MGYLRAKEYGRKELEKINREAYGITYGRKAQRKGLMSVLRSNLWP